MSFTITVNLPPEIEERLRRESKNLDADVQEFYALELFRRGKLSHFELSKVLGLDQYETNAYLKKHNVLEGSITLADLEEDWRTLERVMGIAKP